MTTPRSIEEQETGQYEVASDVLCARTLFVNFFMVGAPGAENGEWVLIDTGLGMSVFFPHNAIDLSGHIHPLPEDGSVPGMPGWRWLHTPGHAPGQVAFFRDEDRVLLAADTFVTVKQESAAAVLAQRQEVHGPPKYLTTDWPAAKASVQTLYDLQPTIAATGHGVPMAGDELMEQLEGLVRDFDRVAVPQHGKYVPAGMPV